MVLTLGVPQALAPAAIPIGGATSSTALVPLDPTAARIKELGPGCELRIIVDDDKHTRVKLLGDAQSSSKQQQSRVGQPVTTSAEIFGSELVPGTEYPLLGGTRTAIYTWHGCKIQINGP